MAVPHLYAVVISGFVVAKRAAGIRPDGTYPAPRDEWVRVTEADYRRIAPGWRRLMDGTFEPPEPNGDTSDPVRPDNQAERLWRKEAKLRETILQLRAAVQDLQLRVTALEEA